MIERLYHRLTEKEQILVSADTMIRLQRERMS